MNQIPKIDTTLAANPLLRDMEQFQDRWGQDVNPNDGVPWSLLWVMTDRLNQIIDRLNALDRLAALPQCAVPDTPLSED